MKHLLGYLSLTDHTGTEVELINGARTLALMRAAVQGDPADVCRVHPFWDERQIAGVRRWMGNECAFFDSGQYGADSSLWDNPGGSQDPNPWEDIADPAGLEVAGFLPDAPAPGFGLQLESPAEARVVESTRVEPLELVVTGTVVAGTERGESAWLRWATELLEANELGWTAGVFTACPDPAVWDLIADPDDIPADDAEEPVYTTWDDGSPNNVAAYAGTVAYPPHSSYWDLMDVRFASIDPLTDQPLFPHCVGRRYSIRFTVGRHRVYDRPRTVATLGGTGVWASGETYTNPLDVGSPVASDPETVLGPPGVAIPVTSRRRSGLIGRANRWSLPDSALREAALLPPRPVTLREQLIVTITNPSTTETVYNARIRFWEADVGQPHPNTQVGDAHYSDIEPVAELRIIRVEPEDTLVFDARTSRVTLTTGDGTVYTSVPGRIESADGARLQAPVLTGPTRYWAAAELSADSGSYGDLDLEVTIRSAMEQIPT